MGVNEKGEGELRLVHHHDGRDLQNGPTGETLKNLGALWGGPVHLYTLQEGEGRLMVVEEGEVSLLDTADAEALCRVDSAA